MSAQLSLDLPPTGGLTRCGYCARPLTLQPEGDWACVPCRGLMAATVVGPLLYRDMVPQWRKMQRAAARGEA